MTTAAAVVFSPPIIHSAHQYTLLRDTKETVAARK